MFVPPTPVWEWNLRHEQSQHPGISHLCRLSTRVRENEEQRQFAKNILLLLLRPYHYTKHNYGAMSDCLSLRTIHEALTNACVPRVDGNDTIAAATTNDTKANPSFNTMDTMPQSSSSEDSYTDDEVPSSQQVTDINHSTPSEEEVDETKGILCNSPSADPSELPRSTDEEVASRQSDRNLSLLVYLMESFKCLYSIALLLFSIVIVTGALFTEQTTSTTDMGLHPFLAFALFWFMIGWLAMMEGGQGALVGLKPIPKSLYATTHSRTLLCTNLAHGGENNMERLIVGRQFLVVLVVFAVNTLATPLNGIKLFHLNDLVTEIFLTSGVAVILITIIVGQLTAQINAASCMLDFINNYFMLFTVYVSLAMEASGLLHSVYLVSSLFAMFSGHDCTDNQPPTSFLSKLLYGIRVLVSLAVLSLAFAVTLSAIFHGKTFMWDGVPEVVTLVVFVVLMCFVGVMEGMQIALFAVINIPDDELRQHTFAYRYCEMVFRGQNLQAFLIGRQILVTVCMFVVARVTTTNVDTSTGDQTIFGVDPRIQDFFNTGLLGAVITTIVGSLIWRVVASTFPIAFLSNPLLRIIIRLCLWLEKSGLCSAAWTTAHLHKTFFNFKPDEAYLGGRDRISSHANENILDA